MFRSRESRRLTPHGIAVAVLFAIGACCGCTTIIGGLLGDAPLRPLTVDVALEDGQVVVTASKAFSGIACGTYDLERAKRLAPDVIRTIWRAACPKRDACMRSVRYGDPALRVDMPPAPLTASPPGQCYYCNVGGPNGRGDTKFRLTAAGALEPCPRDR